MKLRPSRLSIVPAMPQHAADIATRLGFPDDATTVRRFGATREELAAEAIAYSASAWAVLIDGKVLALFGVHRETLVCAGHARPWTMLSRDVLRYRKTFWAASREALAILLDHHPELKGTCDASLRHWVRWLRRLGFTLRGPFPPNAFEPTCYVMFDLKRDEHHDRKATASPSTLTSKDRP